MSMISVIYVKGNVIIYTWPIVVTCVWFPRDTSAPIRDDSYSLPCDIEREAARPALLLFLSPCEIADGSRTDNGSRRKVLSRRPRRHTSCRPGRPASRVGPCCTFRCRTDKRCSLQQMRAGKYLTKSPPRYWIYISGGEESNGDGLSLRADVREVTVYPWL